MTRNKKSKTKKIPDANATIKVNSEEKPLDNLGSYGLSIMQSFMKTNEDVFAIAYRVNTSNMGKEDIINKYKSTMMTALQRKARERGYLASAEKIIFDCLPLGEDTLIKAFVPFKNIIKSRSGEPVKEPVSNNPFSWEIKEQSK
jgi:hypothetical protein